MAGAFGSDGLVTGAVVIVSVGGCSRMGAICGGGNLVKKRNRRGSSDLAKRRCC